MTKIKICGLSRQEDIESVNKALPDYIGFVFAKSKRQIDEKTAIRLKSGLNPSIQTVGVFVNEDPNRIVRLCKMGCINLIQLHGDEGEDYINHLKKQINHPVIKAVRVRTTDDLRRANDIFCDYLLLDAYKDGQYGGSGDTFDWTLISRMKKPYFLAGGISSKNVLGAISQLSPYAIDVSSGVETEGLKDKSKINDLVAIIRGSSFV